jgi:hypothetical protein
MDAYYITIEDACSEGDTHEVARYECGRCGGWYFDCPACGPRLPCPACEAAAEASRDDATAMLAPTEA